MDTRADIDSLIERVTALERELESLRSREVLPAVFLANDNGDGTWEEHTVNGGVLEEFADGRYVDDDEHAGALIEPGDGIVAVIEIRDGGVARYVRLPGGTETGSPVIWGKVKTPGWSGGNTVTLIPVVGQQDDTATGGDEVTAYIVHPYDVAPRPLDLVTDAIVPYVMAGNVAIILPTRVATLDLKNSGVLATATVREINIPAASNDVMSFSGNNLQLAGGSDGQVLIWDNTAGKWVVDYVWLV